MLGAPGAAGMAAGFAMGGLTGGLIVAANVAVMMAGGLLINSMLGPSTPSFDSPTSNMNGFNSSPTYGWGQQLNQTQEGGAIPVIYGTVRTYPTVISQYVTSDNEKQHLHSLYAVAEGEITSISDIMVNDQPITSYTDISWDWRAGTNTQSIINGFDNLRSDQSVNLIKQLLVIV